MGNYKIYLDTCCFNRPFDDLSKEMVFLESQAVVSILKYCEAGVWTFYKSGVLYNEIININRIFLREEILRLYDLGDEYIKFSESILKRAEELEEYNIKSYDALHIASAESVKADVFLTTDRKLINRAKRSDLKIKIENPLVWLTEVMYDG